MADGYRIMYGNISYKHSYSKIPEDNIYERHCHNGYELLYIIKGEGTYVVEGTEYQIKPNTLLIARPCEFHCISPDKNMEYERDVLIFNEHALYNSTVAELSMLTQPATKSGVIYFTDQNKISAICAIFKQMKDTETMFEGRKNKKEKEETMLSSLLTQLLLILSLEDSITNERDEHELMHNVMSYVNRHLFDELSLDRIAQRFFISKYYLCRAFKEYAGISLFSYITAKRIVMADQLIERGESATEAAYKVGFGSYSSFYRAYIKQNGHPPVREYTKKQIEPIDKLSII